MKKYLFAIIILLIPCYSFAVIPQVSDLYPQNKVFGVVDKVWTVPAKVVAKSGSGKIFKTIALSLGKLSTGGILTSLAIAGASYIADDFIYELLKESPPMYYAPDGVLKHDLPTTIPPRQDQYIMNLLAQMYADTWPDHVIQMEGASYERAGEVKPAEYVAMKFGANHIVLDGCIYDSWCWVWHEGNNPGVWHLWAHYNSNSTYSGVVPVAVTYPELKALVVEDIDDATDESAPIIDIVNKGLDKAAEVINDGVGISSPAGTLPRTIADELASAIPESVATELEDSLANADVVADSVADDVAAQDSAKSITRSIIDAFNNFFGADVPPPVDPTAVVPEKRSLTGILQSFYNAIQNMPLLESLNGVAVTASGSSVLCVNLPANLGGTKCWDAAGNQSDFNMVGSALLAVVSIVSVVSIFRG